jgi:hypothetical protein
VNTAAAFKDYVMTHLIVIDRFFRCRISLTGDSWQQSYGTIPSTIEPSQNFFHGDRLFAHRLEHFMTPFY